MSEVYNGSQKSTLKKFDYCSLKIYYINMSKNRKEYLAKWRANNREKVRKAFREWYKKNKYDKPYYFKKRHSKQRKPAEPEPEYDGTSGLGRQYELIACKLLSGSTLSESFHDAHDLEWNGLTIDVKMRNRNKKGSWGFTKKPKCDANYFLCFCVDGDIKHIFLVPRIIYGCGINVTDKNVESKYFRYKLSLKSNSQTEKGEDYGPRRKEADTPP